MNQSLPASIFSLILRSGRFLRRFRLFALCLLLAFGVTSCAHVARTFPVPDATKLEASSRKLGTAVVASRDAVKLASAAVKEAKRSHDAESARIATIEPKVTDLLRVSPLELRPSVQALEDDVTALHGEHEQTAHAIDLALAAQGIATGKLEEANAARNAAESFQLEYTTAVVKLTAQLNETEAKWARDSKELVALKAHRLIGWLIMIAGIVLCGLFYFLRFTGRLAAASSIV